jgi:hypothetical protein
VEYSLEILYYKIYYAIVWTHSCVYMLTMTHLNNFPNNNRFSLVYSNFHVLI